MIGGKALLRMRVEHAWMRKPALDYREDMRYVLQLKRRIAAIEQSGVSPHLRDVEKR
jgi:hypothetical protein